MKKILPLGIFLLGILLILFGETIDSLIEVQPELSGVFEEMTIGGVISYFGFFIALILIPGYFLVKRFRERK